MHILVCRPAASLSCIWTTGRVRNLNTGERNFLVNLRISSGRRIDCISPFGKPQLTRGNRVRAAVGGDSGMKLTGSTEEMRSLQAGDAVVIVDHGSRRVESNAMLHEFVELYKQKTGHSIVEPAHMVLDEVMLRFSEPEPPFKSLELAEPSIANAFDRCVEQGATRVIISPYFLFPGRHWNKDIPALAASAAEKHAGVSYIVTAPIGLHELMVRVLEDRMQYCLSRVAGDVAECDMCAGTGRCQQRNSDSTPLASTSSN